MRKLRTSRAFRCALCLILVVVLIVSWSPIRARAMAGGGVIGGASAAGLALSPGMVGLLLLAAFGVYYMADNEDAIGRSLEIVLEAEATNTELSLAAQAEYAAALTSWWESAKAGAIDLASAPAWIATSVKDWAANFVTDSACITNSYSPEYCAGAFLPANTKIYVTPSVSATFSQDGYICLTYMYHPDYSWYRYLGFVFSVAEGSDIDYVVGGNSGSTSAGYCYGNWQVSSTPDDYTLAGRAIYETGDYGKTNMIIVGLLAHGEAIPYYSPLVDVYPSVITGGIASELEKGTDMDVIGLPDIVIPGPDVLPVSPSEGQTDADAITDYLMAALIAGEITWEQYWELIGVYNPAIGTDVPTVGVVDTETGTIVDTEIGTGTVVTPSEIVDYQIDLKKFFPFCIPFDLYDFFTCLNADPVAPVIEWVIPLPGGETYPLEIDLSAFDSVAQLLRRLQLLLFCVGLAIKTRDLIKG